MNYVAIIDRRGEKQVQKFSIDESQSITVGRGWNCDIVVDDKYIDPVHATIWLSSSGALRISDNGSVNGTRVNRKNIKGERELSSRARISAGDTTLQFVSADEPVLPAVKSSASQKWLQKLTSVPGFIFSMLCAGLVLLFSIYVLGREEASAEAIAEGMVSLVLLIAGWSMVAGLIGKVFRGEARFMSHWVLLCLAFCIAMVASTITEVVQFNSNSDLLNLALDSIVVTLLVAAFGYITFSLVTNLSVVKKSALTALVALFTVGYQLEPLLVEEEELWSDWVTESQPSQPPEWVFAKPTTLDAHLSASGELFESLERRLDSDWERLNLAAVPQGQAENNIRVSEIE